MRTTARRQRRMVGVLAGVAVLALALTACADLPDGIDGDLTGGWAGFEEPTSFVPQPEVCHEEGFRPVAGVEHYAPVDCDQPHLIETVHVGTFPDEAAEQEAPPPMDSDEHRAAYQECDEEAADYLGADFRHGRLWMGVALPSPEAWDGGARWFRCDVSEVESVIGQLVLREGALAGALAEDSALRLGCFEVTVDDDGVVQERTPVSCDEPHQAEYVGVWRAPGGGYPDPDQGGDPVDEVYDGCRSEIAGYTDVPDDDRVQYRVGTIVDWLTPQDWTAGDRGFRCYLWMTDRDLDEPLRGAGPDELPVRTE